ncbi:MAG TPA: hypothetical protein VJ692_11980, partial [Nitrospiraceae bacterium]|nr:hypothetical protein [Nitrospiraceae bacterium]
MTLKADITREARALGFQAVGISRAESGLRTEDSGLSPGNSALSTQHSALYGRLTEWLERGYHGTMSWMGRNSERRADPRHVLPGCRTIISVG